MTAQPPASGANGPSDLRGVALAGRYRLDEPIARGGMAQVWKGTDLVLGRRVAIKMLLHHLAEDPAFAERFRREAQAAARLNDPHIVAIFDSVTEGDLSAIILEYVDGTTLRTRLDDGPLDVHVAIGIGAQVAAALHEAHLAGIVHRDVKPANVLLCRPDTTAEAASPVPRVRVTDFGIAKALEQGGQVDLTRTGSMLGTAKYLAPEQVQGRPVDARTDVYALGVLLYEAVCGRAPWQGESDLATAVARLNAEPVPPTGVRADIPREVEAVILRAMAKEPDDRYATAADLRAALMAADPGPSQSTVEVPTVHQAPTFLQSERGWLLPTLAVLAVVGLLIAGGVALGRTDAARSLVDRARGSSSSTETTTPATSAPADGGAALTDLIALAYDPEGTGGENDDLAGNAVDGATTGAAVWRTECYAGELNKSGVGLVVGRTDPMQLAALEAFTAAAGWRASVYVSDAAPEAAVAQGIGAWGEPVAEVNGTQATARAELDGVEARSVLLWFTSVGGVPTDNCFGNLPNSHRVDVIELQLLPA
ncbi:MAG: protein kinase [Acidimicrobiia bacterium]